MRPKTAYSGNAESLVPTSYPFKVFDSQKSEDLTLSSATPDTEAPWRLFTLCNIILHLDQMEFLELNANYSAQLIGRHIGRHSLEGKFDGPDIIEFVLGSASTTVRRWLDRYDFINNKALAQSTWKKSMNMTSFTNPMAHLWVLDFNQCRHLSMDDAGIEYAVKAFSRICGKVHGWASVSAE